MTAKPINTWTRPRFAWLLWIALLLPLAQVAAAWHAQSHWRDVQTLTAGGKHLPVGDRCEVCVTAAAVTGGGAASAPLVVPQSLASPLPARVVVGSIWPALVSPAYESRAPPFAPR